MPTGDDRADGLGPLHCTIPATATPGPLSPVVPLPYSLPPPNTWPSQGHSRKHENADYIVRTSGGYDTTTPLIKSAEFGHLTSHFPTVTHCLDVDPDAHVHTISWFLPRFVTWSRKSATPFYQTPATHEGGRFRIDFARHFQVARGAFKFSWYKKAVNLQDVQVQPKYVCPGGLLMSVHSRGIQWRTGDKWFICGGIHGFAAPYIIKCYHVQSMRYIHRCVCVYV